VNEHHDRRGGASMTAAPAASGRTWWTVAAMTQPLMILTIDFFGITVALPAAARP
jgi:hypothetical protein